MSLMKNADILGIADMIRLHITPFIQDKGWIEDSEIKKLVYNHTGHQISSERTLQMIQDRLCGEI